MELENAPERNMQDMLAKEHFSQLLADSYIGGIGRSAGTNYSVFLLDLRLSHESDE